MYQQVVHWRHKVLDGLTKSFSPQIQAVCTPKGEFDAWGTSFRLGNLVLSGSKGMEPAVLFVVRKSLTCSSLAWARDL